MQYEPVPDSPALLITMGKGHSLRRILVIADLHLGRETELARAGLTIPSRTEAVAEDVLALCKKTKAEGLILLGDIKHNVPRTSWQEWREVPAFFSTLARALGSITIVIGNHDAGLRQMLPEGTDNITITGQHIITEEEGEGGSISSIGLVHGNRWPTPELMACDAMVMAHNHPTVVFVDPLGGRSFHQCWIRSPVSRQAALSHFGEDAAIKISEVVIMPSFLEYTQGTSFNVPRPGLLGPILTSGVADVPRARVYLLDGTHLGELKDIVVDIDIRGRYDEGRPVARSKKSRRRFRPRNKKRGKREVRR